MTTAIGDCDIGILLPTREALLFHGADAAVVIGQARRAEGLGFQSLWVGDSLTARPRFEPITLLAAIAAATTAPRLGTAILLPALRHPVLAAHQLATLDRISDGRLIVGVGAGAAIPATEEELALVGVLLDERVSRMYGTVRTWRALWSGEGDVDLQPAPAQPGGPPVWLAGEGPQTLRRAGERFDGWLPYSTSPEAFAANWQTVSEASGPARPVTPALFANVTIDDDPAAAAARQAELMEAYYGAPYDFMRAVQCCIAGTADDVAEGLRAYAEAGARHFVLRPAVVDGMDEQLDAIAAALL